ncbi:MAG: enoyl-CoA hydratase/isomerase family protein [Planctomycetota bacterium]|jgi:methylglutaconyl-CoA hydratase
MPNIVLTEIADGCATVTMNRPDTRNALSWDLIEALEQAIEAVGHDVSAGAVRVVILAAAGKAFCAGMDLEAVMSDPTGMQRTVRGLARIMRLIRLLPVPTIARVQGAAIGGGCGLMVVTDCTVTHPEAKIGYPEVSLGLSPAAVAPWLIRKIGAGRARAMLLEGQMLSGREGFDLGLVTHLTERDRVEREAVELSARFAAGSPDALATTKRWLNELEGHLSDELMQRGADLSADVLAGDEAQARLRARFAP